MSEKEHEWKEEECQPGEIRKKRKKGKPEQEEGGSQNRSKVAGKA